MLGVYNKIVLHENINDVPCKDNDKEQLSHTVERIATHLTREGYTFHENFSG